MGVWDDIKNGFKAGYENGFDAAKSYSSSSSGRSGSSGSSGASGNSGGNDGWNRTIDMSQATVRMPSSVNKKRDEQSRIVWDGAKMTVYGTAADLVRDRAKGMSTEAIQQKYYGGGNGISSPSASSNTPSLDTSRGALVRINDLYKLDQNAGNEMYTEFVAQTQDPTSPYYRPYDYATNRAAAALEELGIDTTGIGTREWLNANAGLKQYYKYSTYTNTPSSPGKRASALEKAAYWYYQIELQQEDTDNALAEYQALSKDIGYWVGRTDLNLSNDQIIQKLNISGNSKYKTLAKMDEYRRQGRPMEMNMAIGYNGEDDLETMIWQARNGGGTGNYLQDMVKSASGEGNVWQQNDEILAKLNPKSPDFAPYSVGMTGMDDVGLHFGVSSIDRQWLNDNQDLAFNGSDEDKRMYNKALEAVEHKEAADAELAALDKYLENKLKNAKDPQKVLDKIDWTDYPTLAAMDKSMGKNGQPGTGKWVTTSGAVNYRYQDIVDRVNAACEANNNKANGDETRDSFTPSNAEPAISASSTNDVDAVTGADVSVGRNHISVQQEEDSIGQYGAGNIDLNNRQVVKNEDGSISTERSFSVNIDGKEVLLPTVIDGEIVSEDEAIEHYYETGEYLGKFDTVEEADEYAEKLHERQEARYGDQVDASTPSPTSTPGPTETPAPTASQNAPVIASNGPTPTPTPSAREKTGTQKNEDVLNDKVQDGVTALEGSMTNEEQTYFHNAPGVQYDRTLLDMKKGPLNPQLWNDEGYRQYNLGRISEKTSANFKGTAMSTLETRHNYEQNEARIVSLQKQINDIRNKYGDQLYLTEDVEPTIEVTYGDNGAGIATLRIQEDGTYAGGFLEKDPETGEYWVYDPNDMFDHLTAQYGITKAEYVDLVGTAIDEANAKAARYAAAVAEYGDTIPEDMPTLAEVEEMEAMADRLQDRQNESKADYEAACKEYDTARKRMDLANAVALRNGVDVANPEATDAVMAGMESLMDWEEPPVTGTSLFDQFVGDGKSGEDTAKQIAAIDEAIEDADFMVDYMGNDVPASLRAKKQNYVQWLKDQKTQLEAYVLTKADDFESVTAAPMSAKERATVGSYMNSGGLVGTDMGKALLYLYRTDGADKMLELYNAIEPSLRANVSESIQESFDTASNTAFGRVVSTGLGVAIAPLDVLASGLNILETYRTGEGNTWLELPREFSNQAISSVQNKVAEAYKDKPLMKTLISGMYEILYNRGRSAVVGGAFGGLTNGLLSEAGTALGAAGKEVPGWLAEAFSASPIALTAMDDTLQKYLDAGVEDWKAWSLAGIAFLSESMTEGIELNHIKEAFGVGKDMGRDALATFFHDYIPNALPEVFGESVNDLSEKMADMWIAMDKGDIAKLVDSYTEQGYSDDQAWEMAMRDQISDVAHTAIISFFSPLADVGSVAAGQLMSYSYYADQARTQRALGINPNATVRSVRKGEVQALKARDRMEINRDLKPISVFDVSRNDPSVSMEGQSAEAQQENINQYDVEIDVLEGVRDSDQTTQAATLAAVLEVDETDANRAGAAASGLQEMLGDDAIDTVQDLMAGGMSADINIETLKTGIIFSALGKSADGFRGSRCYSVMTSQEFRNADPAGRAQMLAMATAEDLNNSKLLDKVGQAIHDFRVNKEVTNILSTGAAQPAIDANNEARDAKQETATAQENLNTQKEQVESLQESVKAAGQQAVEEPSTENTNAVVQATGELKKAAEVEEQWQQHLEKQQDKQRKAEAKAKEISDSTMADIRKQAETTVAQQEQAEAEAAAAAAEAAEQARLEAEARQAEEDERSGKAWEANRDALIENLLDQESLEEGEERDRRRNELTERANQIKLGRLDMAGMVNNTEGYLAVSAIGRRLNLKMALSDTLPDGARGMYQNGTVYLNSNLIKNGKMTVGQALVEASLHEITHAMESTRNYQTYRDTVMKALFGSDARGNSESLYQNNAKYRAAIDQKIAEYRKSLQKDLSVDDAEREVIADFARTKLNDREVVMRFLDNGLGAKMRNTLHNINQAIKNFRLSGKERETAEYLRRAERTFQKMINEEARAAVHPEGGQFSVAQIAQATGMTFDDKTLTLYDARGNVVDGVNNKITADMIGQTPVGLLIDNGLTGEQNTAAKEMMAGLMNMVARYKDSNLVWEIGATTLSSTFSALKSNSDPQYATTVDFGTVCAKTQAIIDVMSQVMLDRVKEGKTGGLTREEIMKVYNETHNAGLSVPCPVCYVFSRWMGVPSLLGQMSQYQNDYVVKNEDGSINRQATQEKVDKYIQEAEAKYGDAKAINNAKAKLQSRRTKLDEQLSQTMDKEERDSILKEMVDLDNKIGEVSAYNWITQALCKKEKGSGKYVADPKFKLTPDEILFDLNRTGEFAGYEKNWRYRNTRGAGMGKAIMPYSGETIGDILYGAKSSGRQNSIKNPWLNLDGKAAARQLKNAQDRARKQNLVGGQRLQSTSDFRPEWGLDYIMSFLELQAAGSKTQMYTKVPDAVDFFASVGADVNLSIMGKGQGWHEDENGNKVLDFSSITGMDYETAKALKNKYDNVQMILVGMNDTHIRLAMANDDIDFIIPWHSSGNSKDVLAGLIASVGEKLDSSVDYSSTQTDSVSPKRTEEQKALWDARVNLLNKGGNALTQEERATLLSNPFTADLYRRFTEKGVDADCYGVKLNLAQTKQIFPYEYWDTNSTKENADINGKRFVEYCEAMGIVPRFSQFKDDPGYWKLLIDRPMYNNDGSYHQQQVIDVTNARIGVLDDGGQLTGSDLPTSAQAKYKPNDPRSANYAEYSERERQAIENAKASIDADKKYDDGTSGQYSIFGDTTTADVEQMLTQTDADYQSAVERGDTKSAAEDVESYAEGKGYTDRAYHGTDRFGFTKFNMDASQDEIFVAYDDVLAGTYTYTLAEVRNISDAGKTLSDMSAEDLWEYADENLKIITDEDGTKWRVKVFPNDDDTFTLRMKEFGFGIGNGIPTERTISREELEQYLQNRYEKTSREGIYQLYTRPGNQLVVDAEDNNWNNIPFNGGTATTREIAEWARSNGYDSVRINNVYDNGGRSHRRADGEDGYGDIGIFFSPNDVKSADTVTYDDHGNVIPLNERFNTQNNDIRYSYGGETTLADLDQQLVDSGVVTPEDVVAFKRQDMSRPLEGRSTKYTSDEGGLPERAFGVGMAQDSDLDQQAKDYVRRYSSYYPDTNVDQVKRAINWIKNNRIKGGNEGSDGFYESLQKATKKSFDYRSADGQARMVALMGMAVAKNDIGAQVQLADAFNRQGTDLGRALQSRKIFRMMTPEGRIASIQKMIDNAQEELNAKGKNIDLTFSEWIYRAAASAETDDDFRLVQKTAANELAEQIPVNWKDKLTAWRMLSMLGNPRTHIRNILGNAIFMPAVGLKNKIGAVGEIVTGQKERTKTLGFASKEARSFAKADAKAMEGILRGDAKYNDGDQVQQEQKTFGQGKGVISRTVGKGLQALSDFNGNMLEAEDWIFLQRHYRNALAGYMTANKLTGKDMTGATLEKARIYAVQEAQKATYRDANAIATWLNKAQKEHPAAGFVVNAVLPFKKTPANILKRGVEYSPVGLLNAITRGNHQVKLWQDYQNGKLSELPDKAISPTQWIDKFASGLTGTGIMAMGALLASIGGVNAGLDDDDDEFAKLQGEQEYSLNLNLFGQDVSFTVDWAAPVCMPFFVGATIYNELSKEHGDGLDVGDVLDSMLGITEPVFNLSMLDGVNSLLDVNQYGEGNAITQIGTKIVTNYATSYIPTALGQVARTIDTTRRKSYVESGAKLSQFRYAIEQSENKIPWLSKTNIPYRNVWGEADTSGRVEAAFENFISPGYANALKDDPVVNELERLYQQTGNSAMIPKAASKTISVDGETIRLNAEQYDQYVVSRGQTARETLEALMESPLWQVSDDNTRADLVTDAWTYANQLARHDLDERGKVDAWIMSAETNGNVVDTIIDRAVDRNHKDYISGHGQSLAEALDNDDAETFESSMQALEDAGATATQIKGALREYFKPLYQQAYMRGDSRTMSEIEEKLLGTDAGFKDKDFTGWVPGELDEDELEEKQEGYRWLNTTGR